MELNKGKASSRTPYSFYQTCINEISDLLTSVYNDGIMTGRPHSSFYNAINIQERMHLTLITGDTGHL